MSDDTTKLLNACVEYRAMVDKLERENAMLREITKRENQRLRNEIEFLQSQIEELGEAYAWRTQPRRSFD